MKRKKTKRGKKMSEGNKTNIKYVKMIRINMTGETIPMNLRLTQNKNTFMERRWWETRKKKYDKFHSYALKWIHIINIDDLNYLHTISLKWFKMIQTDNFILL